MVDLASIKDIAKIGFGLILGALIIYLRQYFILTHEYKLKVVKDRIDEFLKDSRKYFEPIALASGDLSLSLKLSKNKVSEQIEIPFYWLAKYLYQRDLLRENTFFYFPQLEDEVIHKYIVLNKLISDLFDYNKRYTSKISDYYASNKEYNTFCDGLSSIIEEFEIFKNKIDDTKFRKKLIEASWDFSQLIIKAISTVYEPWYDQYRERKFFKKEK